MPRSGYPRQDPVAIRSGYVSHDNNPVDHRGGPESHSGRLNHTRMNAHASPATFLPSLDPRSRRLHIRDDQLFSSTAADLSRIQPRDDLHRNEPSQEYERRTRGYNPGYFGERVASFGSSPQLGALDGGYRDEQDWPEDSPIHTDFRDYKRDEKRGSEKVKEYTKADEEWENSRHSTAYLPPHLRNEDAFDTRQSSAAAEASRSYQSASEKRNDHNNDYIGHWQREKREGHIKAVPWAQARSNENTKKSQKHLDSRNGRWRDRWQAEMDNLPEDDD